MECSVTLPDIMARRISACDPAAGTGLNSPDGLRFEDGVSAGGFGMPYGELGWTRR